MSSEKNRFRSRIALVFLFALAIRILCAWPALWSYFMGDVDMESFMRPDSATYYFPARAFVETGKLTLDVGSDFPAVQRPPGYIFFLVAVIFLSCPPIIGCLVDALTVFPVALTGRRLAGRRAGFWAAVLYALNLTALANAPLILADSLLGFLCAWQVFFFVRAWRTKHLSDFLIGTAFAAAATLTKPVNLPVFLVLIPFVLAPVIFRSWRKTAGAILLTGLVFCALLMPWMLRNQSVGAGFVLDRNSGLTAKHNTSAILARVNGTDIDTERAALEAEAEAAFEAGRGNDAAISAFEKEMELDGWYLGRYRSSSIRARRPPHICSRFGFCCPTCRTFCRTSVCGPANVARWRSCGRTACWRRSGTTWTAVMRRRFWRYLFFSRRWPSMH